MVWQLLWSKPPNDDDDVRYSFRNCANGTFLVVRRQLEQAESWQFSLEGRVYRNTLHKVYYRPTTMPGVRFVRYDPPLPRYKTTRGLVVQSRYSRALQCNIFELRQTHRLIPHVPLRVPPVACSSSHTCQINTKGDTLLVNGFTLKMWIYLVDENMWSVLDIDPPRICYGVPIRVRDMFIRSNGAIVLRMFDGTLIQKVRHWSPRIHRSIIGNNATVMNAYYFVTMPRFLVPFVLLCAERLKRLSILPVLPNEMWMAVLGQVWLT